MIRRRELGFAFGAAALLGATNIAQAEPRRVFRVSNPNGVLDASQSFATCGLYPRLGYYEMEGVGIEYVNMSNIVQAMLSLSTGQADVASLAPALYLPAVAKEPNLGIIAAYDWLPRNANVIVVKPDSAIKTVSDLVGKKIGIRNQGDGAIAQLQLMFSELGLPSKDINFIAVGQGGVAGTALVNNTVDAFVTYDSQAGIIEAAGFALRYLPLPANYGKLSSGFLGFRKKDIKEDRKNVVGFLRGLAKSTLFAYTNLPEALSIHWSLYPDSKPRAKSDEENRKEIETIMRQRRVNWTRRADDPDQRLGASTLEEWKTFIAIAAKSTSNPQLPEQIGDPHNVYTNELINDVNNFDKAAVVKQAREFKL